MTKQINEKARIFILGSFIAACSAKVEHLPRYGESLRASAFTLEAGGKGFNLMIGARRMGADVDGVLAVGSDLFAQLAEPALASADLPPRILRRYRGSTGSGIGFTDAHGENCLAVYPGANLSLSASDIRANRQNLRQARLVLAQFEIGDEPIGEAFTLAREAGATTLLNPSPYRAISSTILAQTSVLVLNRVEAGELSAALGGPGGVARGRTDRNLVAAFGARALECGLDAVIVTLGNEGAMAFRRNSEPLYQPAFPVDVVDTLGAGDAFFAGFAVALAEDRPFTECLRRAAACGALATRRLGVFEALPTREELEGFLDR